MRVDREQQEGIVCIAEEEDLDDIYMLTGLFYGHHERDDEIAGEEFEGLTAEEAIAWGRARAPVVLIRTGASGIYLSAGHENPDGDPVWPPPDLRLGRRRIPGFEPLDNTEDDPPVLWDVRVAVNAPRLARTKPFRDAVRRHPAVRHVQAPAPGYQPASAAFLVEASTIGQARRIAGQIHAQAWGVLQDDRLARLRGKAVLSGYEVYPHRPGHPVRGPGITH